MTLAETIKTTIEPKTCNIHGIHPIVEIRGDSYEIICCCSSFKLECIEEIQEISDSYPG